MILLFGLIIIILQVYALLSFELNFRQLIKLTREITGRNFGIAFKTMSVTKALLRRQRSLMFRAYKKLIFTDLNDDIPELRKLKLRARNRISISIFLFLLGVFYSVIVINTQY